MNRQARPIPTLDFLQLWTDEVVDAAAAHLRRLMGGRALDALYRWPLSDVAIAFLEEVLGHELQPPSAGHDTERTLWLRALLEDVLDQTPVDRHLAIADWIVTQWGGITTAPGSGLVESALAGCKTGRFRMARVASWSKYLAFRWPGEFAILDARTVYSLNWLLLRGGARRFVPMVEGRNSLLGAFDFEPLLLVAANGREAVGRQVAVDVAARAAGQRRRPGAAGVLRTRAFVAEPYAYPAYCHLVTRLAARMHFASDRWDMVRTEMALFALADTAVAADVVDAVWLAHPALADAA